jgi:hypothetical protein
VEFSSIFTSTKELLISSSKESFNFSRTFQGCLRLLCACCVSSGGFVCVTTKVPLCSNFEIFLLTQRESLHVCKESAARGSGLAFKNSGFLQRTWKFVCAALAVLLCPTPRLIVIPAHNGLRILNKRLNYFVRNLGR